MAYATGEQAYQQLYQALHQTKHEAVLTYFDSNWHGIKEQWVEGIKEQWVEGLKEQWVEGLKEQWVEGLKEQWVEGLKEQWVEGLKVQQRNFLTRTNNRVESINQKCHHEILQHRAVLQGSQGCLEHVGDRAELQDRADRAEDVSDKTCRWIT
ncbi:hypothetical protein LSAT2_028326 [Lamellibrachia satsuma]|nr:hypothetical protein LSAT2_028326 [Lamellibrachia satsuma]